MFQTWFDNAGAADDAASGTACAPASLSWTSAAGAEDALGDCGRGAPCAPPRRSPPCAELRSPLEDPRGGLRDRDVSGWLYGAP